MSKVLSEGVPQRQSRRRKYLVHEAGEGWVDGRAHLLERGKDFDADLASMRSSLYGAKDKHKILGITRELPDGNVVVQYFPPTVEDPKHPEPDESKRMRSYLKMSDAQRERLYLRAVAKLKASTPKQRNG